MKGVVPFGGKPVRVERGNRGTDQRTGRADQLHHGLAMDPAEASAGGAVEAIGTPVPRVAAMGPTVQPGPRSAREAIRLHVPDIVDRRRGPTGGPAGRSTGRAVAARGP